MKYWVIVPTCICAVFFTLTGCGHHNSPEVVVYVAHDEMYSKPVLDLFSRRLDITVRAVYDTEASKTTGLASRLFAEKDRPRADVFWNNEVAQTIALANKGVFEPYQSPFAETIPAPFKDSAGMWTGFAARARVIIYNTDLTQEPPKSIRDFADPKWKGKLAIAMPLFGTTATHAAALFAAWGENDAKAFLLSLKANDVAILSGNAAVRDMVASGEYTAGLTDTDDANGGVEDGKPVKWIFPDQEENGLGTLLLPNTVAMIHGAPHPEAAKQLIDYLLSGDTEMRLASSRSIQIPLKRGVHPLNDGPALSDIHQMKVDYAAIAEQLDTSMKFVREIFNQ